MLAERPGTFTHSLVSQWSCTAKASVDFLVRLPNAWIGAGSQPSCIALQPSLAVQHTRGAWTSNFWNGSLR